MANLNITIATRPNSLDGCWQTWDEKDNEATLRSEMELGGFTKVRLRVTDAGRQINASVTLPSTLYADFMQWYRVNCTRGLQPTRIKQPDGKEIVARFSSAPTIRFPPADKTYFTADCIFEQLPAWRTL